MSYLFSNGYFLVSGGEKSVIMLWKDEVKNGVGNFSKVVGGVLGLLSLG